MARTGADHVADQTARPHGHSTLFATPTAFRSGLCPTAKLLTGCGKIALRGAIETISEWQRQKGERNLYLTTCVGLGYDLMLPDA